MLYTVLLFCVQMWLALVICISVACFIPNATARAIWLVHSMVLVPVGIVALCQHMGLQ